MCVIYSTENTKNMRRIPYILIWKLYYLNKSGKLENIWREGHPEIIKLADGSGVIYSDRPRRRRTFLEMILGKSTLGVYAYTSYIRGYCHRSDFYINRNVNVMLECHAKGEDVVAVSEDDTYASFMKIYISPADVEKYHLNVKQQVSDKSL